MTKVTQYCTQSCGMFISPMNVVTIEREEGGREGWSEGREGGRECRERSRDGG